MDIQPSKNFVPLHSLPPLPIKRCEFCQSVFITDTECESCGRQFKKDTLGTPGGEKSFYALRDQYKEDIGNFLFRFDHFLAKDAPLRVRYLSLLKKRYLTLIDYLQRSSRSQVINHAFLIEFRDLAYEMQRMKISTDYLYDMILLDESAPITAKMISILNEEFSHHRGSALKNTYGINLRFLLGTLVFYSTLCAGAVFLFSYLLNR